MRLFASIVLCAWSIGAQAESLSSLLKKMNASGTRVSAAIENLTTGKELVTVGATTPLNPASSIKLFTAYVALKRLGINYTFKTLVYNKSGDLCVKGGGDPAFVMEDMYILVEALKRRGLESFTGKITVDASFFDDEPYGEERTDQNSERAYNAPISGLNFNYNTITVYVNPTKSGKPARVSLDFPFEFVKFQGKVMTGSSTNVTWDKDGKGDQEIVNLGGKIDEDGPEWHKPFRIRNPSMAWGSALYTMLGQGGVKASGALKVNQGTCTGEPMVTYESKPLGYIVGLMNKYSNNFIADSLVKTLDHEVKRRSGTTVGGIDFISTELQKIGILLNSRNRSFASGSGLTRENKIAASDFMVLLKAIEKEKLFLPEMFASLPIAGLDGTLKRKYKGTDVADRLRGKTGTLNGVQSLVGVYPNKKGDWIGVSIITNGPRAIPEGELAKFLSE